MAKLKKIKILGNVEFDWRNSSFCHCTIKEIYSGNKLPKDLYLYSKIAEDILSKQKSFKVTIKNLAKFSNVVYVEVYSKELIKLHKKLSKVLPSVNPNYENESFLPHISLVVSSNVTILSKLKQDFGKFEVKEIPLKISNLKNRNNPKIFAKYLLTETS